MDATGKLLEHRTTEQIENQKRFTPYMIKKLGANKRLNKSDMGYQIGSVQPHSPYAIFWFSMSRPSMVEEFNKVFGTNIK